MSAVKRVSYRSTIPGSRRRDFANPLAAADARCCRPLTVSLLNQHKESPKCSDLRLLRQKQRSAQSYCPGVAPSKMLGVKNCRAYAVTKNRDLSLKDGGLLSLSSYDVAQSAGNLKSDSFAPIVDRQL
jgi:hypothetical protein